LLSLPILFALVAMAIPLPVGAAGSLQNINHVVVIYQENWSFDGLYGKFPGANGLANDSATVTQVDKNGTPYTTLPQPIDTNQKPPAADPRFPANMPVQPFDTAQFVKPNDITGDLVHRYYQEPGCSYENTDSGAVDHAAEAGVSTTAEPSAFSRLT